MYYRQALTYDSVPYDFIMVQKFYAFSRNHILNFELFPG